MASRLTELGPRIHAFANEDEAYDALACAHHDPDLIPLPTPQPADLLPSRPETDTPSLGRVLPLRPTSPSQRAGDAAENFGGEAA